MYHQSKILLLELGAHHFMTNLLGLTMVPSNHDPRQYDPYAHKKREGGRGKS